MDLLLLVALVFALLAAGFLATGVWAARRKRVLGGATAVLTALLMLALGALAATLSVGTQGYRALTKEVVAAVVEVEPAGEQAFRAVVHLPDSSMHSYDLRGDQVYVDARILKWKPVANVLGLHTEYELDRVAGRYMEIEDERGASRTVHPLGEDKPVDVFDMRRRFSALTALVDAEYGSASYVEVDRPRTLEVRVSTSGLLIRPADTAGGG